MKSWVLEGDVLELADGETRIPAEADEVYASVVEQRGALPDLPTGKCGDAARLAFSRYPVDMAVVIGTDEEVGEPVVAFEARTQRAESFPVSKEAVLRGHVVHGETWYACGRENTEALKILLEEAGYDPVRARPGKLAGYLVLKRAAREGGPVIDRLPDDALSQEIDAAGADDSPEGITVGAVPVSA